MSGQTDGADPGGPEPVGSVAEEAAEFFGAFSGWAKEHGDGLSSFTDGLHEHVATGSPECAWCPVCRTVSDPPDQSEVLAHLTTAASSLMLAVAGMMAPPQPGGDGVERIPLDDDWPEDDA